MNAYAEKIDIIQWIAGLNDKTILLQLKKIKDQVKHQEWWDSISEEERLSIEQGLDDSKNGRITPHSEIKKRYENLL